MMIDDLTTLFSKRIIEKADYRRKEDGERFQNPYFVVSHFESLHYNPDLQLPEEPTLLAGLCEESPASLDTFLPSFRRWDRLGGP